MKSLNKTETPISQSVLCSLFPKGIFSTFISLKIIKRPLFVVKLKTQLFDFFFDYVTFLVFAPLRTFVESFYE